MKIFLSISLFEVEIFEWELKTSCPASGGFRWVFGSFFFFWNRSRLNCWARIGSDKCW